MTAIEFPECSFNFLNCHSRMGEEYLTEQKRGKRIYFYPIGLSGAMGEGKVFGNKFQTVTFPMSTLADLRKQLGDGNVRIVIMCPCSSTIHVYLGVYTTTYVTFRTCLIQILILII